MAVNESGSDRKITIYDVAAAAGVSASTVSRAFARPGRVSFATAEKIRKVAEELGYQSVAVHRPMAQGNSRRGIIALVIADIANPVYFDMIVGAESEAARNGYTLLLAHSQESSSIERIALEQSMDIIDGIILSSSRMSDSAIRSMAKQKPTIVMNRGVNGVSSITTDNTRGVARSLEHLAALGHKEVLYVAGPKASWANGMRWGAIKQFAPKLGMRYSAITPQAPTREAGSAVVAEVVSSGATAVIAYNDLLALGVMHALQLRGMRVPRDISIIGFDNSSAAELVRPGLTTVAAPLQSLGETAVRNLLALTRGAVSSADSALVLPTKLIVRNSTGAPHRP